jgi:tRNA threonylcarbamoyladenosine biosynthesis protein TsaB
MNVRPSLILAIESAIAGGSLSLIDGNTEIANWIGVDKVARGEDLIENTDHLLRANNIAANTLDLVAVSAGPGSFTGIRIGIATALGLKNGLGVRMSSISVLRAMALTSARIDRAEIVAAVPVGRDQVCYQSFQPTGATVSGIAGPETLSSERFNRLLREGSERTFILHEKLYEGNSDLPGVIGFINNLAYAIGSACRLEPSAAATPLFVSKGI